jgi:LMBR1-like membrane protein
VPLQVKIVTGYAWLTTLLICCIVPIDVFSTLRGVNPLAIDDLWDISYWSTQLLTWLLIPIYMGYADAGEFTWKGRMLASASF